ncbi:MAG TPA: ABC transporter ATP-binding protein [Actinomycetota bacterium]|jgi:ABC-2 type transport system ATP-binding protein
MQMPDASVADGYVVETRALTKRFGTRVAVDAVDLSVPAATAFGFLGPNGAGKTTLIRTLLGLTRPTSGDWRLLGRPMPADRAAALRKVGAIVEEPRFHPHLTGRENLEIVAAAREPEASARIPAALDRVGLTARADERVSKYSLGMRQRLGVARCLLADPLLLILDEPMNGLDPAGIQEFREMVASLVGEGRTVFLSSHLLDEVEKTCDHVAIIDRGRILMQGSVADIARTGQPTLRVRCGDPNGATDLITATPDVEHVTRSGDHLVVVLRADLDGGSDGVAAEVVRRLVHAGVAVYSIEPERVSLEERFLELTSRLEDPE